MHALQDSTRLESQFTKKISVPQDWQYLTSAIIGWPFETSQEGLDQELCHFMNLRLLRGPS